MNEPNQLNKSAPNWIHWAGKTHADFENIEFPKIIYIQHQHSSAWLRTKLNCFCAQCTHSNTFNDSRENQLTERERESERWSIKRPYEKPLKSRWHTSSLRCDLFTYRPQTNSNRFCPETYSHITVCGYAILDSSLCVQQA